MRLRDGASTGCALSAGLSAVSAGRARNGGRIEMATRPVDELSVIHGFGPHVNRMSGARLSTAAEPDRLVKTHCCFCGQQCGIQLKVKDNLVIGFEPWEEFPF